MNQGHEIRHSTILLVCKGIAPCNRLSMGNSGANVPKLRRRTQGSKPPPLSHSFLETKPVSNCGGHEHLGSILQTLKTQMPYKMELAVWAEREQCAPTPVPEDRKPPVQAVYKGLGFAWRNNSQRQETPGPKIYFCLSWGYPLFHTSFNLVVGILKNSCKQGGQLRKDVSLFPSHLLNGGAFKLGTPS